jgi:3-isopropylmalate/(R)-2-methylmalate dehydratase large subunit
MAALSPRTRYVWRFRRECKDTIRKNLGRPRRRPETTDTPAVLYVDLHLVHEVTSPQAFSELRERGLQLRRPIACWPRWTTPLRPCRRTPTATPLRERRSAGAGAQLETNCREFGVELYGWDSADRGIVHVIGPELGATQPGMTIVCGDSHTSTHGAFGALAFGIGTTEVGHVMATQCLLQRKPKTLAIHVDGKLPRGVSAKDLILHIIGTIGVDGGTGYVLEYRGARSRRCRWKSA